MSLLFKRRLNKFKIKGTKEKNFLKDNISSPSILSKKYKISNKITFDNPNKFKYFINPEEVLVKSLDLNDSKTSIPFIQIINNSKINISDDDLDKKRREKLYELELKEQDINISNKISSNVTYVNAKKFKEKIYIKKLQTLEKEENLLNKLKELENKIDFLKESNNEIYKNIIKWEIKMNQNKYDLEDIKAENNTNQNIINQFKRRQTRLNNFMNSLELFESQRREYDNYQEKKNKLLNNINNYKSKIDLLKKEQNENKISIKKLKYEYKSSKNELLEHYHRILFEGIDSRKEGLSWVIQAIWDLGEEVNMSFMPNFLDHQAINYLFAVAKKRILFQKMKDYIEQFKTDSCNILNNKKMYDNNNKLFLSPVKVKTNILSLSHIKDNNKQSETLEASKDSEKKIKYNLFSTGINKSKYLNKYAKKILDEKNLIKIKDYIKLKKKDEINNSNTLNNKRALSFNSYIEKRINKLENKDDNSNEIENESLTQKRSVIDNCMEKFNKLIQLKKHIKKDIDTIIDSELRRIWDEFLRNEYEKIYKINIKIVISALVGENNMIKEIEKQDYIVNQTKILKKNCHFYDTFENGKINSIYK